MKNPEENDVDFSNATCFELLVKSKTKNRLPFLSNNYTIPDFQRGYVWKKNHIERLIESISSKKGKYLGNIVVLSASGGTDFFVDGQQRLVTISLLCKILEEKTTSVVLKKRIKALILRDSNPRISFSNKEIDRFFKKIINSSYTAKGVPDSAKNISSAIMLLRKNVFLSKIDNDQKIKDFLCKIETIQFGVIKCLHQREVYNLFEGLNSTGVILTSVEKTKNALLGRLYELDPTPKKTKLDQGRKIWDGMESKFNKINPFLFNKFLRHQWFLIGGKVSDKKLYEEIIKIKIKPSKNTTEVLDYLNLIKDDSNIYIKLKNGSMDESSFPRNSRNNTSKDIIDVLQLFNKLGIEQVYPVLLALYKYNTKHEEYCKNSRFFCDIKRLWAFSFLAKYGKIVPSVYENVFAKLCLSINNKSYKDFKTEITSFFKNLASLTDGTEDKFIKNFNTQYSDNNDKFCKSIFSELYKRTKEIKLYEVEHILPQGKSEGCFTEWKKIPIKKYNQMKSYIYKIGNLTLIEKGINRAAENLSFEAKILLYEKSEFPKNQEIKTYTKFRSASPNKAICCRGADLSEKIFKTYLNILKSNV